MVVLRIEVSAVVEVRSSFFFGRVEVEGEVIVSVDCKLCVFVIVEQLGCVRYCVPNEGSWKKVHRYGDASERRFG